MMRFCSSVLFLVACTTAQLNTCECNSVWYAGGSDCGSCAYENVEGFMLINQTETPNCVLNNFNLIEGQNLTTNFLKAVMKDPVLLTLWNNQGSFKSLPAKEDELDCYGSGTWDLNQWLCQCNSGLDSAVYCASCEAGLLNWPVCDVPACETNECNGKGVCEDAQFNTQPCGTWGDANEQLPYLPATDLCCEDFSTDVVIPDDFGTTDFSLFEFPAIVPPAITKPRVFPNKKGMICCFDRLCNGETSYCETRRKTYPTDLTDPLSELTVYVGGLCVSKGVAEQYEDSLVKCEGKISSGNFPPEDEYLTVSMCYDWQECCSGQCCNSGTSCQAIAHSRLTFLSNILRGWRYKDFLQNTKTIPEEQLFQCAAKPPSMGAVTFIRAVCIPLFFSLAAMFSLVLVVVVKGPGPLQVFIPALFNFILAFFFLFSKDYRVFLLLALASLVAIGSNSSQNKIVFSLIVQLLVLTLLIVPIVGLIDVGIFPELDNSGSFSWSHLVTCNDYYENNFFRHASDNQPWDTASIYTGYCSHTWQSFLYVIGCFAIATQFLLVIANASVMTEKA